MSTSHLNITTAKGILQRTIGGSGWALCIGAGTSIPVFSNWETLVGQLVNSLAPHADSAKLTRSLLSEFSPDSVIQAARNVAGGNDESFVQVLANSLYENLRSSLTPIEWRDVSRILARPGKRGVPARSWKLFLECFQKKLPATTAIQIANVLTPILGTPLQPAAILSFNAEAMLFALLNALTWARDTDFGRKEPKEGENRELLDPVTRSISDRNPTKVAYIFCHGLLPVPDQPPIAPFISTDKLVFSEASYLHLASTSFSWQSSAFLDVCSSKTVIFVGVSLADPNMRRWLSWIHENRSMEIKSTASVTKVQGQHLWIRKRPKDDDLASWLEASVELLGVRIVWIEDWSQVESAIRAMLNP